MKKSKSNTAMALIKCTGCGHEISDKASTCPHCGTPVSHKEGDVCKECGIQLPKNATVCPNCGCPTDNVVTSQQEVYEEEPEKKKWWIWALAIALLCLIGGWAYYGFIFQSQEETKESVIEEKKDSVGVEEEVRENLVELTPTFLKAIEKYDQLGMFSEGYASVLKNGKWGYINTKGEEVIPAAINATCVGRFSEGLAFVLGEDYSDFRIINTEGKTVFKGNCDFDCISYDSEEMPYFKNGKIYVDKILNNQYKYEIYDKLGKKTGSVDWEEGERYYKKGNGEYTIFENTQNAGQTVGLKDSSGNIVLPADYNSINGLREGKTDFNNGVVLAVLCEADVDEEEYYDGGGILSEGGRYFYGYADLKGNDTFSAEQKRRCAGSETASIQSTEGSSSQSNVRPDWLQGRWTADHNGHPLEVIIEGDRLTFKVDGHISYNGTYEYNGNMLIYNNANDFWSVDNAQQTLTYDGRPMKKGGSSSSSSGSNSGNNSYRFTTAHDVIGYLSDKTFYNGDRRLRIRPEGVWLNDYCATGAPHVERYESWKAIVRAFTATGERISFLIDPVHGQIIDETGDAFSLR